MANLEKIQEKLNSDKAFRDKFTADPVGTLNQEGLNLSKEMEASLEAFKKSASSTPSTGAPHEQLDGGGIAISISF